MPCLFTPVRCDETDLETLLDGIASGTVPIRLGDAISTRLKDGAEIDLVVTAQDDKTVRFESRDCTGIRTTAKGLDEYLQKVYDLLPDALKQRIVEVERPHLNREGEKYTGRCKLFLPAASEVFPTVECFGDTGLYDQMPWYREARNRIRAKYKGGDRPCWYWTSSAAEDPVCFCAVRSDGAFDSYAYIEDDRGYAPFCFLIAKG